MLNALEYYTVDPFGRRCADSGDCKYSPYSLDKQESSEGCLIGRLLSPELAKLIDEEYDSVNIDTLIWDEKYSLPNFMNADNARFLRACQNLHDIRHNWSQIGLSGEGQGRLLDIIEEYNLDKSQFEKFLN